MIDKYVLCRTYRAGVHMGWLKEIKGKAVLLADARRLWRWEGAFTLHEVSQDGIGPASKVSDRVPLILLTEVEEVILCSDKGRASLDVSRNSNESA